MGYDPKLCECGCGEIVKKGNRFIQGHNGRANRDWITVGHKSNEGRIPSIEKREKISESLMGHPVSLEQKKKIGETFKKRYWKGEIIHPMLGKKGILAPGYIHGRYCCLYSTKFFNMREQIRKRDNYTCQNCGMTEEEHLIVRGVNLSVHHIDYNRENDNENNLITVCSSCHARANFNRDYWKEYYKNKIEAKNKEIKDGIRS